jgi:hypothetical protein
MLDYEGMIIERKERPPKHIFTEADIGMLYIEPATWDEFNDTVDKVMADDDDPSMGCPLTDNDVVKLNQDGIRAQLFQVLMPPMNHCYFRQQLTSVPTCLMH